MQTVTEGIRSQLGQRVRGLRLEYRVTQEQLAERAGLSYKFIGEIERGKANPTVDTLSRLAKALRVEIHELLLSPGRETGSQAVYRIGIHDLALVREALKSADRLLDRFGRPSATRKSTPKTRR
jgi:transcriptional regulator with XRE-family HTH domain